MIIKETIKRTMVRARKRVDSWIGYSNLDHDEGPSLSINASNGYRIEISFRDLAYLVRKADDFANSKDADPVLNLKNWRDFT